MHCRGPACLGVGYGLARLISDIDFHASRRLAHPDRIAVAISTPQRSICIDSDIDTVGTGPTISLAIDVDADAISARTGDFDVGVDVATRSLIDYRGIFDGDLTVVHVGFNSSLAAEQGTGRQDGYA
jgi:hypothetical protein